MIIWKDIEGCENYQINNLGQARSITRIIPRGNHTMTVRGKMLKVSISNEGYCSLNLRKNNKRHAVYLHRVIAKAFIPNPDNKAFIDHRDHNPGNNNIDNLSWCTQSENMANMDSKAKGLSIYKGVTFDKSRMKWAAKITFNYKTINLGRFQSEVLAAKAYNDKAKELFGNFAKLNAL